MAIFASNVEIYSLGTNSKVNATYEYESQRVGNSFRVRARVKITYTGSGWMNNRVRAVITIGGTQAHNAILKPNTSGSLGGKSYTSAWSSWVGSNVNSGSVTVSYRVYDEQNSSGMNSTRSYNAAVIAPTSPSVPRSLLLPYVAPDKVTTGTWTAPSSGGTNGVSGYQVAYSVNGGASQYPGNTTSRSYAFNLNSIGVQHGQTFSYAVRAYTTVNGTNYYSSWVWSPAITSIFTPPGIPTSLVSIGTIAPDKNKTVSWTAPSSKGSNGVSGYQIYMYVDDTLVYSPSVTTNSLSLPVSDFASHGSKVYYRVRAYTIGKGTRYYSGWATSNTVTTNFVAPSVPVSLQTNYNTDEPLVVSLFSLSWTRPTNIGSNGVSGYEILININGVTKTSLEVTSTSASVDMSALGVNPGDVFYWRIRAYTIGKNTKYYSSRVDSSKYTLNADKFINVSLDGASFVKHKMYIIFEDGTKEEVRKTNLSIIS